MRCPACGTEIELERPTHEHDRDARAASGAPSVFRREGEYWFIAFEGGVCRLRDRKGLGYLAALLANPSREILSLHLLGGDLDAAAAPARFERGSGLRIFDPTAAEAVLDPPARAAYERRLEELGDLIEQADAFGDEEGAARARREATVLAHELAAAVGLGGRSRTTPSPAEKARQSVTKAIKVAAAQVARHHPVLGRHLAATVRTGIYCVYDPDPRVPVSWRT